MFMDEINRFVVRLIDEDQLGWTEVYEIVKGDYPHLNLSEPAIRGRYYRHSTKHRGRQAPTISGVQVHESISIDKAITRARELWRETLIERERQKRQSVSFSEDRPICLMFMADTHVGSVGVDYDRLFEEAEIVSSTPDTYIVFVGDLVDQFVLQSMSSIRFHTRMSIPEEWAIARGLLDLIAHKIIVSVAGNHDNWTNALVGIDYFKDVLEESAPNALYAIHSCRFRLDVGSASWTIKARHKWRGTSIHNPTYGIERAAQNDRDFDIGIGAHTHVSGLVRQFNNGGKTGYGVLCGSLKRVDEFADYVGFPRSNESATIPLVFSEQGSIITFENVKDASKYMWKQQDDA